METSLFLAQLIGAFSLVMGLSMALRRKMLVEIFRELFVTRILSYILGVAMFLIGLLLVVSHSVWEGPLYVRLITVVGWLVVIESLAYLFVPKAWLERSANWARNPNVYYGIALIYLVLGAYLAYAGFFA